MLQTLYGTVLETCYDKKELSLDFAPNSGKPVEIELTWNRLRTDKQMDQIIEGCFVMAKVDITGWADMPYPHLGFDRLKGELHNIIEVEEE